ncbi:MAG: coenzyme F420-0:L-glutamate ligase [Chloroflexi bacterium]|nr:coenzyme F420-0:L-glutamate ligase [Chloroflexota bacterium]
MTLTISPLKGIPLIRQGDDLADILLDSLDQNHIRLENNDILVLAQKIVSKAEGRSIRLSEIVPSTRALDLAEIAEKDPRLMELILRESTEVLRLRKGAVIVEHRLGFVCANAGIDHSNVSPSAADNSEEVLLLPLDPDRSARSIREDIQARSGKSVGVMIIDSHGRAWRNGTVGTCIGLSGVPPLIDERGWKDLFGNPLKITIVGVADELAAAASLMIGQAAEGIPAVQIRGFPYPLGEGSLKDLIRERELDLFR